MRGFTFTEILIVLAIVGILSAVAIPSYQQHRLRAVQTQGMVTLQELAQRQARLRLASGTYESAEGLLELGALPKAVASHYRLAVEIGDSGRAYILRLIPRALRDNDPEISLDHIGRRRPDNLWF